VCLQIKIDEAVQKLAADAYEVALKHMRDNREAIDVITELLIEKETLGGDEFRKILSEYTTIPAENLEAAKLPEYDDVAVVTAFKAGL
jgi:cell division protease FtsH